VTATAAVARTAARLLLRAVEPISTPFGIGDRPVRPMPGTLLDGANPPLTPR
jgi:hypothetical protein